MSRFRIKNEAYIRRVLLVFGAGLIALGLLLGLLDKDATERTIEQSQERTARIHASLEPVFALSNTSEQHHQLDELLAELSLDEVPQPHPERISRRPLRAVFRDHS